MQEELIKALRDLLEFTVKLSKWVYEHIEYPIESRSEVIAARAALAKAGEGCKQCEYAPCSRYKDPCNACCRAYKLNDYYKKKEVSHAKA